MVTSFLKSVYKWIRFDTKTGHFLDLIRNQNSVKVFHAARQDLEIMNRLCDAIVLPVFDTQVAASVVGWGSQISFAKIVNRVIGKKIDKSETYTDWCRRPLSENQIKYALDDVRLLFPVYKRLIESSRKKAKLKNISFEEALILVEDEDLDER